MLLQMTVTTCALTVRRRSLREVMRLETAIVDHVSTTWRLVTRKINNDAVRLKLAFCTTCAVRVPVLAQRPSFLRLRRALLRRRGGLQDERDTTVTSGGVEAIRRSCSTSTEESEVVWKW